MHVRNDIRMSERMGRCKDDTMEASLMHDNIFLSSILIHALKSKTCKKKKSLYHFHSLADMNVFATKQALAERAPTKETLEPVTSTRSSQILHQWRFSRLGWVTLPTTNDAPKGYLGRNTSSRRPADPTMPPYPPDAIYSPARPAEAKTQRATGGEKLE